MVGHVRGFFQVPKRPFPFNPPVIMQSIPNELTCFPNEPLQFIKNYIIPLLPYDPRTCLHGKKYGTSIIVSCWRWSF